MELFKKNLLPHLVHELEVEDQRKKFKTLTGMACYLEQRIPTLANPANRLSEATRAIDENSTVNETLVNAILSENDRLRHSLTQGQTSKDRTAANRVDMVAEPSTVSIMDFAEAKNILGYIYDSKKRSSNESIKPEFNGDGTTAGYDFIRHVEHCGKAGNWNMETQVMKLIGALAGNALKWYNTVPTNFRFDLKFLKKEIVANFKLKDPSSAISKLRYLNMGAEEDVESYWYKVNELCYQIDPNMNVAAKMQHFIHGLPRSIAKAVIRNGDYTMEGLHVAVRTQAAIRATSIKSSTKNSAKKFTAVDMILEEAKNVPLSLEDSEDETDRRNQEKEIVHKIRTKQVPIDQYGSNNEAVSQQLMDFEDRVMKVLHEKKVTPQTRTFKPPSNFKMNQKRVYAQISNDEKNQAWKEKRCFKCMEPGHFARDCPQVSEDKGKPRGNARRPTPENSPKRQRVESKQSVVQRA